MVTTTHITISPADALWALYQSQTEKEKKAFLQRIVEEEASIKLSLEMDAYEQSLTEEQRMVAHDFVEVVKQRINDVEQAAKEGRRIGRSANDFLQELQAE